MLYVNDELVKKGTSQWERYNEFKKNTLPKFRNPVIIRTSRPIKFNSNGLPEPAKSEWIPLDQETLGEDGGEHWRYCERPPRKRPDGNFVYNPRGKIMKNAWVLDRNRDSELIFFFHELSAFHKEKGLLVFEDKKRDAREILAKETSDLDVRWMITSRNSPISVEQTGSEDTLRMIASAWGVENAHDQNDRSLDEIKVALLDAVKISEKNRPATGRGYKEFLRDIDNRERVSIMATIQKAIDMGVITYDKVTFSWRFTDSNTPIATIPAREASNPQAALNKFLSLNDKSAKILEAALGQPVARAPVEDVEEEYAGEEPEITSEKLGEMGWNELRNFARDEYGIRVKGLKRPVIEQKILEATSDTPA